MVERTEDDSNGLFVLRFVCSSLELNCAESQTDCCTTNGLKYHTGGLLQSIAYANRRIKASFSKLKKL